MMCDTGEWEPDWGCDKQIGTQVALKNAVFVSVGKEKALDERRWENSLQLLKGD
jgi:hypothetical protein